MELLVLCLCVTLCFFYQFLRLRAMFNIGEGAGPGVVPQTLPDALVPQQHIETQRHGSATVRLRLS